MTTIAVFVNPHARKNRATVGAHADHLQTLLGDHGRVWKTGSLEELGVAVGEAFEDSAKYYVADGGDGSFNCVLHELRLALEAWGCDSDDPPPVAPTRAGSIDFLARKVGITGTTATILSALRGCVQGGREPPVVKVESLRLTGTRLAQDGTEIRFERLGFALAAGGVGQRFFAKYDQETPGPEAIMRVVTKAVASRLAGRLPLAVPRWAREYGDEVFRPTRARVTIDGQRLPELEHEAIHAGAFPISLGGVFRVFPLAEEPGILHFQAGRILPREMIRALPRLVRGDLANGKRLVERAGREMLVEAMGEELLEPILDGEPINAVKTLRVAHGPAIPIVCVG